MCFSTFLWGTTEKLRGTSPLTPGKRALQKIWWAWPRDEFALKSDYETCSIRDNAIFWQSKLATALGLACNGKTWQEGRRRTRSQRQRSTCRGRGILLRPRAQLVLSIRCMSEMEPGHGSPGHRVSNLGPGRVGSGRVTGQSPDPAFWPGFLFSVVKNRRQSVSFIIVMRYRGHWHVSHKTSSRNFCIKTSLCGRDGRTICGPQRVRKSTCVSF